MKKIAVLRERESVRRASNTSRHCGLWTGLDTELFKTEVGIREAEVRAL